MYALSAFSVMLLLAACSATKFVPDGEHMLTGVSVVSEPKGFNTAALEPYIRQKGNSKWFSLFKIPLGTYSLAGRDTTKWINRTLQGIGEQPVIFDTLQARLTCEDLRTAMIGKGYLHAAADLFTETRGKKLHATYMLHPGPPFEVGRVEYVISDDHIAALLEREDNPSSRIKTGEPFSLERLDAERKRLTAFLLNHGYYRFHKDFIRFDADTARNSRVVDITLNLTPYLVGNDARTTADHPQYTVARVNYLSGDAAEGGGIRLRRKVLETNTAITEGKLFSNADLQKTYNNFARLQAVRYTNIKFSERPDTLQLDCDIQLSMNKMSSVSFQPEGTNTAGDFGAAASLTYENRNLFRGSEVLSVQLRSAFEAITGLEGYQNEDYEEYSLETKLAFPRFVAPLLSRNFRRRSTATSELSLTYDLQNRPEFHRRVFSTAWRYRWTDASRRYSYRCDLLDLNYVHMPWISATF